MNVGVLIIVAIVLVVALFATALYLDRAWSGGEDRSASRNMRTIVQSQRDASHEAQAGGGGRRRRVSVMETAAESSVARNTTATLTVAKRLKYAQWSVPVSAFHMVEMGISLTAFCVTAALFKLHVAAQFMTLVTGPLLARWLLNLAVERRFKAFDSDYPQFLLSLVGLLKTGMNALGAIEAASHGLEEGSLMKAEVELMLERLRYGVPEDASIGSFAEDIYHPEIELFVQALLLSRRVGGTLSDTLDRLAKQVRKRQYFRKQAVAAVGMQRGSIWFIIGIMVMLEAYLWVIYPAAVIGAIRDPVGWQVWQCGIGIILFGMWWVRQVTKIKV